MRAMMCAAALLALGGGAAGADTIDNLDGNTLVVTYPSGNVERFHVDADGGFAMTFASGQQMQARWTREGDQFCVLAEGAPPGCSTFPADKSVGDSWTQETPNGAVRYEIVAGRP